MYKFMLLCPVALFNFGLYHEVKSFLPKLEVWYYIILFFPNKGCWTIFSLWYYKTGIRFIFVSGHLLKFIIWIGSFGHTGLISTGKACYVSSLHVYWC